jgi:IclR family acetate operon transcriptional repressor
MSQVATRAMEHHGVGTGRRGDGVAESSAPTRGAAMSSAVRVLQVCEGLSEHQPVGVRELARLLDLPRSTVQRALDTLLAAGWAVRSTEGVWSLSLRCAVVGARAGGVGVLRDAARPAMARLQRISDESVRLWMREGDHVVLVESIDSLQPLRYVSPPPGATLPLHASASGKAILSRLPSAEVDEMLSQSLVAVTEHTLVDPDELRRNLEVARTKGYAETYHEARADIGGVAAAVVDPGGRAIAALSLALPMHRLTDEIVRRYGEHVVTEAAQLSAYLAGRQVSTAAD